MPVFSTPEPVHVLVDVGGATVSLRATPAGETTADVRPHDPDRAGDVGLAERTVVELSGGRLTVRSPRSTRSRLRSLIGSYERVEVDLTVPEGSALEVRGWGDVTTEGPLGAVDIETGMGDVRLDRVAGVRAKTAMGDIRIGSAEGPAELRTAMGSVRVGRAAGAVTARTATGEIQVDEADGELKLTTPAGDVRIGRAGAGVQAKTSAGDIRIGSVVSGTVDVTSPYGLVDIGVAHGTAAWLDVEARHGTVRSELEGTDGPGAAELTVRIRAVVNYGDIVLRRV